MAGSFELEDLSNRPEKTEPSAPISNPDDVDGTMTAWSLGTSILLLVLSGLFVISPRLLIFMTGESRVVLTSLEAFLALQFGILLFSVSVAVLVNVPPGALYSVQPTGGQPRSQFSHPLITPMTCATLLMSLSAYNTTAIGML